MTTIKISENEQYVLKIVQDSDLAETPRDWDNLGTMVCFHRNYDLGDPHNYDDNRDFMEHLIYDFDDDVDEEVMNEMSDSELMDELRKHIVILPLYLYDHSGITMNTTGFTCSWDSGQIGWIYVSNEDIIKEYGRLDIANAESNLRAEVSTYDQYLTGDVYGFILEEKNSCDCCGNVENEHIDSCWGFYGLEYIESELAGHIGDKHAELIENLKWA